MKKLILCSALFALSALFSVANAAPTDYFQVLKRTDMHDLYDQYMNVRRQDDRVIGFNAWYKIPRMRSSFTRQAAEKSAVLTLTMDGREVNFSAVKGANYWQPDALYGKVTGSGVTVEQKTALLDDQVGWLVKVSGLKGKSGEWQLRLKAMNQGKGSYKDNVITFELTANDWHKGYTHNYAFTLPENAKIVFKDVKVKPYRSGYGRKAFTIDTETCAFITFPVDGKRDTMEFFLISSIDKDNVAAAEKMCKTLKNPTAFFDRRKAQWQEFFDKDVPLFECSDLKLLQFYAWSYYAMKADTYYDSKGKPYYIAPSKEGDWLPFTWDEDSAHIVTGARWLNSNDQLKMVEGMIFHFMRPKSPLSFGLLTMAGWELYLRTGDREFLNRFYTAVKNNRKNYLRFMQGDLVVQTNSFLIGWDNSLRYAWSGFNKTMKDFERPVIPVDLNSYMVREYEILAMAADILGKKAEAESFRQTADKLSIEINRLMWDEKSGFYYDIFADDKAKLFCKAASGFTPLLAGIADINQAQKLMQPHKDYKEFGSRYAVPTLAVSEPKRGRLWSGDIAGRNNYIVEQGIARYDRDSSAWITHKTMELFMREQGGCAAGYQKPDRLVKNMNLFITEMAGGLDMMIRHVIGFTPEPDGFSLLPAALDKNTDHLRWQINYRGKAVEVLYDKLKGYTASVDGKVVYHSKELPKKRQMIKFR